MDETIIQNGCIAFLPNTHNEQKLKQHKPLSDGRKETHTIGIFDMKEAKCYKDLSLSKFIECKYHKMMNGLLLKPLSL